MKKLFIVFLILLLIIVITACGKQYGVPGNFSNVVLIYNKDLFDQAEIKYPNNDWTWNDAIEACQKIHALGKDIYGIYQSITFNDFYKFNEFYKVAAQYGGSILSEDKTEFAINSEANMRAAKNDD